MVIRNFKTRKIIIRHAWFLTSFKTIDLHIKLRRHFVAMKNMITCFRKRTHRIQKLCSNKVIFNFWHNLMFFARSVERFTLWELNTTLLPRGVIHVKHYMKGIFFTIVVNQQLYLLAKEVKVSFERRATDVPNSIDRIELNSTSQHGGSAAFETKSCYCRFAVPQGRSETWFQTSCYCVPNSIYILQMDLNKKETF